MSDVEDRLDRLESLVERQQETIERQEELIHDQRDTIETLENRLGDEPACDPSVSRRGALKAGGVLGLLGAGVGTTSADPQGHIGTENRPLETLHTAALAGPLTGGEELTSLTGDGLTVENGTLEKSTISEPSTTAPDDLTTILDNMEQDASGVYLITNDQQLQAMNADRAADYRLASDIDASDTDQWNGGDGFDPIGDSSTAFTGTLEGDGHTITGLTIDRGSQDNVGLFGRTDSAARIETVALEAVDITGGTRVGGLVGDNFWGAVSESSATGNVSGDDGVGGLIGYNDDEVSNCDTAVSVSGSLDVGGFIGESTGDVSNCYATGSVSGSTRVGGFIGENRRDVSNCYATGSVSGTKSVGGLVGYESGAITKSYATGSVGGTEIVGGLVGYNDLGEIAKSYATGSVSGSEQVGGLVGLNVDNVSNSYATGSVDGTANSSKVAGLVGDNAGKVSNSYATGSVSGSSEVGGLVGYSLIESESYWDIPATGQDTSEGDGIGLGSLSESPPAAEMIGDEAESNMSGLDFTTIWATVDAGTDADVSADDYPVLQALDRQTQLEVRG